MANIIGQYTLSSCKSYTTMEIATARSHNPKRKRDTTSPPPPFSNGETAADEIDLSLLDAIEKSQSLSKSQPIETLDLKTLKKLILSFERKYKENIESRLKYPDHPEKFADSEIDLHNELQKLKILSSAPELYPDLITLNSIPSVLSLLSHENTDIAIDVIQLLQDLTDEDVVEMSNENEEESMKVLVNTLIENNVLELLVQNLQRLSDSDDQDEMAAVYNTLATVENMIEVEPKVAEMICEKTRVLKWLLGKLKVREFDSNKQYAAEILSILLQNSEANQKKLGQMNGVDVVLQAVAMYKSKDPKSGDEEEMVENLFDCLCCLLMPLENKERFVKAEGVELMIIIMKQKKLAYGSAIRALDFAMTNYPPACERFVDVLGLKTAFAAFMGKASYFYPYHDLVFPNGLVTFIK
ncbi:BETA-CATENIN-LIKE PROTEIN 1 NUCLEAR ASSOCIATED PROTEIN [Salix viminalis]|uniref:BETA-CATENIN-LIKE PROTEIN 1 NUCLEAR ASSOCIATED PROTEIN n=1 Tax=Salix viminalis TaxID=40686 RepID=A0A9Q0QJS7_SALVM|nr:BETA-CATENIN-LIKE PROTEIN 1 NUCLEAR ASSOCIATED PROTEIN [Salix viminalis]